MRVLSPTRVWLEEGEVVPVMCVCGNVYQPPAGSQQSRCPNCHRLNFHDDQAVTPELVQ